MKLDILGRVKNISLPTSKPLLPLFEAIVNSIHAIDQLNAEHGRIDVTIVRDENLLADEDKSLKEIIGFEIADNGLGFTDENFDSFSTSDTQYKAHLGGKGIGGLFYLTPLGRV